MAFIGQEEQIREFQERFKFVYAVLFLCMCLLSSRLVYLQILKGGQMRQYSEENRLRKIKIAAPRGMIFDRNNTLLIDNRLDFDLQIIPQYLKESRQGPQVIARLAKILKMRPEKIFHQLERAKLQPSFTPVKIKTNLTRDEVAQVEIWKMDMPGVEIKEEIKRTHIFKDIAAHLLGYIGEVNSSEVATAHPLFSKYRLGDNIGRFGLEQRMESVLRGVDGEEIKEVDALGRAKLEKKNGRILRHIQSRPPVPGKNLVLTIDQDLQQVATEAFGDRTGALVAIDPRNGAILAMLSRPSFDPTSFSRGIPKAIWNQLLNDESHPLRDKTIQDHYSPGSTFKVITAIAALEEGVIDENTTFHCSREMKIGNRLFHCTSHHGEVNLVRAITQSCNIFFYRAAMRLSSVDDLSKWASLFGLGKKSQINLAGEVQGLIPTVGWKQKKLGQAWNPGETAAVAIGQSFVLVTTLQLANLYAALGNGGTLFRPYIVKQIDSAGGGSLEVTQPEVLKTITLQPKTSQLIKQGLWNVMNTPSGTGYSQRLPDANLAGKTGTSQVIRFTAEKLFQKCESKRFKDRHHATFVGFAPVDNPTIAIAVIGEHLCHGSTGAAPVARAVIKKYLEKYFPETTPESRPARSPKLPFFKPKPSLIRPISNETLGRAH